jgi:F-type H+-transporting ATPase subunit a
VTTQFISSPLEQFAITAVQHLWIGNVYFSFTNSALSIILSLTLFLGFHSAGLRNSLVPNRFQALAEMLFDFVRNLIREQVGVAGKAYFPVVYTLFTFILCANLFGMIPFGFTSTSHLVITFGLSVSIFIGVTIVGFLHHGIHFLSILFPPGAPIMLAPLLVVLELVSYCFRAISLGVRLFANMMAGHTLVVILAGFGCTMFQLGGVIGIVSLVPMLIVFALIGLEMGVAMLQAYVFGILTCIYLNDAIALH